MSVTSLFQRFSARSRAEKFRLLRDFVDGKKGMRVLDLGGEMESVVPLKEALPPDAKITLLNLQAMHLQAVQRQLPDVQVVQGDATKLPFEDQSFDLIYSNAVIEHLVTDANQEAMAREIQRVGRSWFVTTPNRWFPFEFHMRLPFVTWLPRSAMHWIAKKWSYNHVARRYQGGNDQSELCLLSGRQMQRMFPTSRLVRNRVTVWAETLVVLGGRTGPR